jgi:hypothetical protein
MDEHRLAEIEARINEACSHGRGLPESLGYCVELLAEVRRLQRALHLSELSRGMPSTIRFSEIAGQD